MPAAAIAFIFSSAVPSPPEMMAPAWPHAAARRCGLAGDEADDGLLHEFLDEERGLLFGGAADFANHDDGFGVGVVVQEAEGVDVGGPR